MTNKQLREFLAGEPDDCLVCIEVYRDEDDVDFHPISRVGLKSRREAERLAHLPLGWNPKCVIVIG